LGTFVGGLMQAGLSDGKKFDGDQAVDVYAEQLRTPPSLVRSDEQVAASRKQAQEAQEQAAMVEQLGATADAAKTASETRTSDGKSILDGVSEGLAKQGAR
jgi:3-deoxy-D-arabino-heptulosonate 7-phosphate (DAHP) synthase class II